MAEDLELQTYLYISSNIIGIYLFEVKNQKNFYKEEIKLPNEAKIINLNDLDLFLEKNIFKIEKLIGKFIKNISLIIDDKSINNLNFGIKKKIYEKNVNRKNLENALIDAKDLFKENFQNEKIMHILLKRYLVNGSHYSSYEENISGDNFCLELEFIYLSSQMIFEIEKTLRKYQISANQFLDGNYIKNLFKNDYLEISEMAYKVQNGFNNNEVKLIPKNVKKMGFFEKFFQLFS